MKSCINEKDELKEPNNIKSF